MASDAKELPSGDEEEEEEEEQEEEEPKKEVQQLNFGKRLSHTDKVVRDRGFRFFKAWLQKHRELERLDYLKLWKGLFFGMWMSDKRHIQQDLSVKIAMLLNDIPHGQQIVWVETFWETMISTWDKLDVHRMSKYMQFVRIVVAEMFKVLRVYGWKESEVVAYGRVFTSGIKTTDSGQSQSASAIGLVFHLTHFFWDELKYQLEQAPKAPPERVFQLMQPLYEAAENGYLHSVVKKVNEGILRQCPPEVVPILLSRIEASVRDTNLPDFNREALVSTAAALGKSGLEVSEKHPESKKQRLKRREKDRDDFVAKLKKKRKLVTEKEKFVEEFLAKGRDETPATQGNEAADTSKGKRKVKKRGAEARRSKKKSSS